MLLSNDDTRKIRGKEKFKEPKKKKNSKTLKGEKKIVNREKN